MTQEFNLSKHICEDADMCYPSPVLMVENVKEFIRLLKEVLSQYPYPEKCYDCGTIFKLKKQIDKLAGDKLL
ncbi:hypothetical protein M0R04_15650 [Candidatus Dojkabacteria bacterium]|jgi:hypothetical protein|nr:hypothetical protein [Candidatus Dojkabacteria bacterium]